MLQVLGVLACFAFLAAVPFTFALWHLLTRPPHLPAPDPEPPTVETTCGDSEHLPVLYPIEDALIIDDIAIRKARIAKRRYDPALTPNKKSLPAQPIRKLSDRKRVDRDHELQILN